MDLFLFVSAAETVVHLLFLLVPKLAVCDLATQNYLLESLRNGLYRYVLSINEALLGDISFNFSRKALLSYFLPQHNTWAPFRVSRDEPSFLILMYSAVIALTRPFCWLPQHSGHNFYLAVPQLREKNPILLGQTPSGNDLALRIRSSDKTWKVPS